MTQWIDQQKTLDLLVDQIEQSSVIGLDTEFVRVSTFHPKPGLIQVAIGPNGYLIDPLADIDLKNFGEILSGRTVSILHAAQEDYEVIYRLTGTIPNSVFDTQIAHALLSPQMSLSLSGLVESVLGKIISKDETRSDWTKRPLTEAQCRYAREDVMVLQPLYEDLHKKLSNCGRLEWMMEEMAFIYERNKKIFDEGDLDTQVAKFGSAWRLSEISMSRLVHLVQWREETARRVERPRKHVLSDQSVFALAQCEELERHHQLISKHGLTEHQAGRFGDQLKKVLANAQDVGGMAPPPMPLSKRLKDDLRECQKVCDAIAVDLGIAPEMLIKKRHLVASLDGRGWRPTGWRAELLDGVF